MSFIIEIFKTFFKVPYRSKINAPMISDGNFCLTRMCLLVGYVNPGVGLRLCAEDV